MAVHAPPSPAVALLPAGYRPWLDGVRGVAILMVVVQHVLGEIPLGLGFVGVGVFFGLSGYLITSLLLDEQTRSGTVSLREFYLRRAARLAPALVLVVLVCNPIFAAQGDLAPVRGSAAALTYTANYVLVLDGDAVPGYGYTWSLAVEEHFYVVWPLVLLWLCRRYGRGRALQATLAICALSLAWRALLALLDAPYVVFLFGSVERADALLYGCAAALAVRTGWRPRRWMLGAGIGSILVLPLAYATPNYPALVLGNAVLGIAAAAIPVGLDLAAGSRLRRWLSAPLLVQVGVVSYGIYLWHGPLLRFAETAGLDGVAWRSGAAAVAVLAAAISYRYLERPLRRWVRTRVPAS